METEAFIGAEEFSSVRAATFTLLKSVSLIITSLKNDNWKAIRNFRIKMEIGF